jgi:hypothetical protein
MWYLQNEVEAVEIDLLLVHELHYDPSSLFRIV